MIPPLIGAPDPRLDVISTPVGTFDDGPRAPTTDMVGQMCDAPGIGLAV